MLSQNYYGMLILQLYHFKWFDMQQTHTVSNGNVFREKEFLPARRMHSTVCAVIRPMYVCLSQSQVYCVKTAEHII